MEADDVGTTYVPGRWVMECRGTRFGLGFSKLSYNSDLGNGDEILEIALPVSFFPFLFMCKDLGDSHSFQLES